MHIRAAYISIKTAGLLRCVPTQIRQDAQETCREIHGDVRTHKQGEEVCNTQEEEGAREKENIRRVESEASELSVHTPVPSIAHRFLESHLRSSFYFTKKGNKKSHSGKRTEKKDGRGRRGKKERGQRKEGKWRKARERKEEEKFLVFTQKKSTSCARKSICLFSFFVPSCTVASSPVGQDKKNFSTDAKRDTRDRTRRGRNRGKERCKDTG